MPPDSGGASVIAVLLAGGLARRMGGGDKCLRCIGGESLLARIVRIVKPQAGALVLNANGDPARFAAFGLPVVADSVEGFAGPLAGVLSGMTWARANVPKAGWIVTVPTDAPFLPPDLIARLVQEAKRTGADIACAASAERRHPVVGAWRIALADDLRRALVDEGLRKIDAWTARYRLAVVEWSAEPIDPFFNANRPEDLAEAERLAGELDRARA